MKVLGNSIKHGAAITACFLCGFLGAQSVSKPKSANSQGKTNAAPVATVKPVESKPAASKPAAVNPATKPNHANSPVKANSAVALHASPSFGISADRRSTLNKEFVLKQKDNELPVVVCKSKYVWELINGYLFESLVAEEFEEVNGDEEGDASVVQENKKEEKAEIEMDVDSLIENAADMHVFGEIDYYDGSYIGITIVMESLSNKAQDKNHYLFNAKTGEVVDVWALKQFKMKSEWIQKIKTAYSAAVDLAINTPCLLENQSASEMLLSHKILKDSDFQMDEFTRSQPVYVRDGKLIFDFVVLPFKLSACDPAGVQLPIQ